MKDHKNTIVSKILIVKEDDLIVKVFKVWRNEKKNWVLIEFKFKNKQGEKIFLSKEYKTFKVKPWIAFCTQAIVKYWPGFNVQKHHIRVVGNQKCKRGERYERGF